MIVRMSQPWQHPQTGQFYYRGRLPADLVRPLTGQTICVEVAGQTIALKPGSHLKVSLRTKDVAEARARHATVQAQLEQRWAAEKKGATSLSHRQTLALAGVWYREMVGEHTENPGKPFAWEHFQELLIEALAYFDPDGDGVEREAYCPAKGVRALQGLNINVDPFLAARNLKLDETSRTRLIEQVAIALANAAQTLERRARGDYGQDRIASRFPAWEGAPLDAPSGSGIGLLDLVDGWARELKPKQSTVDQWRSSVVSFVAFVGHDRAADIEPKHVMNWMDHLLDRGNSRKTINGSKLAALNTIYRWGIERHRVSHNPAVKVRAKGGDKDIIDMESFSAAEAAAILRAAAKARNPVYRWVPLLCASSGARVSEICQLRAQDVREENGIWCMSFNPAAGSVKNRWSIRLVPLHPHVIEQGFLEFAAKKTGAAPLFHDLQRKNVSAKRPSAKIVAKYVVNWVHGLGLQVGSEFRKAPNHAWRHRFPTAATDLGINDRLIDAILGHRPPTVGRKYGRTLTANLAAKHRAIVSLPLPGVYDDPPRYEPSNTGT